MVLALKYRVEDARIKVMVVRCMCGEEMWQDLEMK